ncbi:hypothetical protein ACHAXR_004849 [Thalassiosira sp. AJA248-18]
MFKLCYIAIFYCWLFVGIQKDIIALLIVNNFTITFGKDTFLLRRKICPISKHDSRSSKATKKTAQTIFRRFARCGSSVQRS